ncbi:MAG: cyclic nucleotide-binding domain-containing protein, partial [Pseudomonadota bacterium]
IREDGETSLELGVVEDGNVFGETGVICGRARSATVVAAVETTVLRTEREAFLELLQCKPLVSLALTRELAKRLDTVNGRLFEVTSGRPAHG